MFTRILFTLFLCAALARGAEEPPQSIRIAVAYRDTPSGVSHLKGVEEAVVHHPFGKAVTLIKLPYHTEKRGFDALESLIREKKADLVLGPTDSGVYQRLVEARSLLEAFETPVVASLVAAEIKNQPDGWLFRTNVGVSRRAQVMYDFLNRHWIRRIGVLYADNGFGRAAEQAFHNELGPAQQDAYVALPYEMLVNSRQALRQILERKPEALGVFGPREEILDIYESIQSMNNGLASYTPLLFTLLDGASIEEQPPEFYYVSLTNPESKASPLAKTAVFNGDEDALAFDTTWLCLNILQSLSNQSNVSLRQGFRDRFSALLDQDQTDYEPITGMRFASYENKALPSVYKGGPHPEKIQGVATVPFLKKLEMKVALVYRGVGMYPLGILLFFLAATYWMGFYNIATRYPEVKGQIIKKLNFHLVVWINIIIISLLYLFLAETGAIYYDSLIAAVMILVTSKALLHSTLFETPAGKAIGLAAYHDKLVNWLGEMIMVTAYESEKNSINILAYHNTLRGMTEELKTIYHSARSHARTQEMIDELERELANEPDILGKRKICARRLLRRLSWSKLQERHFAPRDLTEKARDPERIIRAAMDFCLENNDRMIRLEQLIRDKMEEAGSTQYPTSRNETLKDHFEEDTRDLNTEDRVQASLGYLFLYFGYGEQQLIENGFLEDPQWVLDSCILTCELRWKSWLKLQEIWHKDLDDLSRSESKRLKARLRTAPSNHQAIQIQLEFLAANHVMSRAKMIDLGLCLSRTQLFTLSYQYCRHKSRSEASLDTLREMTDNPQNRDRFESLPNFDELSKPEPTAPQEVLLRYAEARRQIIKKCLNFLIYTYGYGPYPLMQRDLFPNPNTLVDHCVKEASNTSDLRRRIRTRFYAELRSAGALTARYYKTRLLDGVGFTEKIRLGKQFLLLGFKLPDPVGEKDFEWANLGVMIRLIMHKHDYATYELGRMGILPENLPWLDEARE